MLRAREGWGCLLIVLVGAESESALEVNGRLGYNAGGDRGASARVATPNTCCLFLPHMLTVHRTHHPSPTAVWILPGFGAPFSVPSWRTQNETPLLWLEQIRKRKLPIFCDRVKHEVQVGSCRFVPIAFPFLVKDFTNPLPQPPPPPKNLIQHKVIPTT